MVADILISFIAGIIFIIIARKVATALFESTVLNVLCTLLLFCLFSFGFHKTVGTKFGKQEVDVEALMLENAAMSAIKEKNPQEFDKLRDNLKALVEENPDLGKKENRKKIGHYIIMSGHALMPKYIRGADDAAIAEYTRVDIHNLGEIRRSQGGEACFYAMSPAQGRQPDESVSSVLSEQQRQALSDSAAKVIRSYNPNRPMPKPEEVEPVLRGVMAKIANVPPPPEKVYNAEDRTRACDFALAFGNALIENYSPKQIADVIRLMD